MAKGTEVTTIQKRTIHGNRLASGDGEIELFAFIEAPDPFGAVNEDSRELRARRAYLRAFFYGLRKYMPKWEYEAMCTSLVAGEQGYKFRSRTAERIQAHAGQFARIKQLYPWENAAEFERLFFAALRRRMAYCEKQKEYNAAHCEEIRAYKLPVKAVNVRCTPL